MKLSRLVGELALEFNSALEEGLAPSIETFLSRTQDEEDRRSLLVQLLVSESAYSDFQPMSLVARFLDFPELSQESVIELLRLIYSDRVTAGEQLSWDLFSPFGFPAERLCLLFEDDPTYLGQKIHGRYELETRLGAGTFGVVHRANDAQSGDKVAIKAGHYPEQPDLSVAMIRREAEVANVLKHDNIVKVRDFFTDEAGRAYLVMDYLPGGSLLFLVKEAPTDPSRAARILAQVSDALAFAHRKAIFHRDLKPENILLDLNENAYVSDFGFALPMEEQWNKEGEVEGTFAYMAPELLFGETHKIDRRSDIWSVGMILYELLTNTRLAADNTREASLVAALVGGERELEFPTDVPERFRKICSRCLERDPNLRFGSAEALTEALKVAIASIETGTGAPSRPDKIETARSLNAWRLGVKLGGCRKELRQSLALFDSILPIVSHSDEKPPSQATATLQLAFAHELRAGNLYRECSSLASEVGLELPGLPKDHGRLFFKVKKLTCQAVHGLQPAIRQFEQIIESAILTAEEGISLGNRGLLELGLVAASLSPGNPAAPYLEAANRSSLPHALFTPLAEAIRSEDDGVVQYAFNQLDKKVEQFLSNEPEPPA
jgi:serine/threonine protein kinase